MDRVANPLEAIGELLAGRAHPVISPERLAPSSIYDLHYRMAVVAAALELHAKASVAGERRMLAARLKFLQFIACRPWLLDMVRHWSKAQRDAHLLLGTSQRLRYGYLGDQMHEEVIVFLVARGILEWTGAHVKAGPYAEWLRELHAESVARGLFSAERSALTELLTIRITTAMLEGW